MSRRLWQILVCAGLLCTASEARGGAVQFQIGEQDFADGKTPVYSREIREAGAGEAYPFDGTIFGHDVKSSGLGAFEYLHTFDLAGHAALSAKLTVGLIDIDSPADHPFDTVALTFDGIGVSTDLFKGISAVGKRSSVEVVDIPVPVELLADGMLQVRIAAKRPGYGNLGNAIEADFSRLTVDIAAAVFPDPNGPGNPTDPIDPTPTPGPGPIIDPGPAPHLVPLPPAIVPAGLILLGIARYSRRHGT